VKYASVATNTIALLPLNLQISLVDQLRNPHVCVLESSERIAFEALHGGIKVNAVIGVPSFSVQ
jgi:hypothetical protein